MKIGNNTRNRHLTMNQTPIKKNWNTKSVIWADLGEGKKIAHLERELGFGSGMFGMVSYAIMLYM